MAARRNVARPVQAPPAPKLRITWRKSAIGHKQDQKRTIQALGLRRLGHTVERPDNRAVRGMITKVRHLVEVSELPPTEPNVSGIFQAADAAGPE